MINVAQQLVMQATNAYHDYWNALAHHQFVRPYFALLLPLLFWLVLKWERRQISIRHSTVAPHKHMKSWSLLVAMSYAMLLMTVTHLDLAMMGPTVPETTVRRVDKIRNVCILTDHSGSMTSVLETGVKDLTDDEAKARATKSANAIVLNSSGNEKLQVTGQPQQGTAPKEDLSGPITRSQGAQLAARFLIRNRMSDDPANTDRYCLMRFDDDLYVMAPLTTDKMVLMLRTLHITENVGGGTNFIVALTKIHRYMTDPEVTGENSVRAVIMDTDGFDSIPAEKRKELIAAFKEARIKLYIIGLGDGWKEGNSLDLQKLADELHKEDPQSGIVFRASNPGEMQKAMMQIDALHKAQEIYETKRTDREVDYAFILGALGCGLIHFLFATAARRIP